MPSFSKKNGCRAHWNTAFVIHYNEDVCLLILAVVIAVYVGSG